MKLNSRDAQRYFAAPDLSRAGVLIYGPDAMRVALKRQQVIANIIGPDGEAEMRITRLASADLRGQAAAVVDAIRARGFFDGPRAVFVDGAPDSLAPALKLAVDDWQEGDAQIIVTAGQLTPRSALRKLFEGHQNAYIAAVYADPPSPAEVSETLSQAGLRDVPQPVMADLVALADTLDPGDFRQTVEKLSLYKLEDTTPVSAEDVAAISPVSVEAEMDDLLTVVAEGRADKISPLLKRMQGQGQAPVSICIAAIRHFRTLHAVASYPGGAQQGIAKLRPPVFGPRRDKVLRQAQNWGAHKLEEANAMLLDADLALRSSNPPPQMAMIERVLIRLAFKARR
ncbi:DNA polymerase III subunit delta [Qingshengfaniella alkalisoli]|uniref:DNA-directed DNA polymerase n=1 Tax=Qingshengfaniella alkalisoli TaxID=2599296 RepID=A0A5B8IS65_9RHOB|nr:DNA polymerase III subunit delta [Qingshengfaniella alkalisoli]QDY68263.1 DNA polymerase III subunit delta [Qingshengfaniella alkalisoli]